MDQETLKIAIDDLRKRIIKYNDQIKRSENAIEALQNICEHDFGSGDHSYENCEWCGLLEKNIK